MLSWSHICFLSLMFMTKPWHINPLTTSCTNLCRQTSLTLKIRDDAVISLALHGKIVYFHLRKSQKPETFRMCDLSRLFWKHKKEPSRMWFVCILFACCFLFLRCSEMLSHVLILDGKHFIVHVYGFTEDSLILFNVRQPSRWSLFPSGLQFLRGCPRHIT